MPKVWRNAKKWLVNFYIYNREIFFKTGGNQMNRQKRTYNKNIFLFFQKKSEK